MHGLYIAIVLVPIIDGLAPQVKCMVSPWKTCSGAKNSRMGTLKGNFKNVFENLGVVFYSTEMFSGMVLYQRRWKWRKKSWWFYKRHW
jgi:hypothetical protein